MENYMVVKYLVIIGQKVLFHRIQKLWRVAILKVIVII